MSRDVFVNVSFIQKHSMKFSRRVRMNVVNVIKSFLNCSFHQRSVVNSYGHRFFFIINSHHVTNFKCRSSFLDVLTLMHNLCDRATCFQCSVKIGCRSISKFEVSVYVLIPSYFILKI